MDLPQAQQLLLGALVALLIGLSSQVTPPVHFAMAPTPLTPLPPPQISVLQEKPNPKKLKINQSITL
jgi:hypothetical protein